MAVNMKRKQSSTETASKASKRSKPNEPKEQRKVDSVTRDTKSTQIPKIPSILSREQPAFPRGGADLLTPLEKRQINAQAIRDVEAERNASKDLFSAQKAGAHKDGLDESEIDDESQPKATKVKKSKKMKVKESEKVEDLVSIEGLSYKRLAVGSLVLGCITAIGSKDLTVALPDNLTGFVPLTSISAAFNKKVQQVVDEVDKTSTNGDPEEQEGEDAADIDLTSHFHIDQYIRVAVTSLGDDLDGSSQFKKKISLSVDPQMTNAGLTKASLAVGCTVQATVTNIEDHGIVVDLAIKDGAELLKGFIPAKAFRSRIPLSSVQVGAVHLCAITSIGSNGRIVKLTTALAGASLLKSATSIDAFLPGTSVEVLITKVVSDGIAGKIMGLLDATADIVHSGSYLDRESFADKYKIGQRVKGRLIFNFPLSEVKKVGFSVLEHITQISGEMQKFDKIKENLRPSTVIESAQIVRIAPGLGAYLSLVPGCIGFAHVSRLSDKKVETISETMGLFKLKSEHKARILDYNPVDGLYIISLQNSVIEQPFLRVEDVSIGQVIKVKVEKLLVGANGVQGLIVVLAEGVTGLVPQIHLSDVSLLHPEKKFREGSTVSARVLSVDPVKRQTRLTLKKTLVNSDQKLWTRFEDISPGNSTIGTLIKVERHGALVQFFGQVKGFLPVSEMSEAYIQDATDHFKVGQVLTVNALSINVEDERLTVSCRDRGPSLEASFTSIIPGTLVSGNVFEKSQTDMLLRLEGSDIIARLTLDHFSDASEKKRQSAFDKIRVGQRLEDVLVLDVQRSGRLVVLSNRQSLVKAAQNGQFLKDWEDLKEDQLVTGFITNITDAGVFVRFAGNIGGLIPKNQVSSEKGDAKHFGLHVLQAVTARVTSIDYRGASPRFWLSMKQNLKKRDSEQISKPLDTGVALLNEPVDKDVVSLADLAVNKVTKARIVSIKGTQINVELAKDIHGRVDVSELFDTWEDIKDRKKPLHLFNPKQILNVRVLGAHDTRNHRFLPLSHRKGKNTVFELSAKPSTLAATDFQPLTLADMEVGSSWIAYVNNIVEDYLLVNISPMIRGRIRAIDVSDDLSLASALEENFPLGSALRVKVKAVDVEKNHLDLTGKSSISETDLSLEDLSPGTVLPGRVTKVTDRSLVVQLSSNLVGVVELIDMADDYTQSNTASYEKNDIIRTCVVKVDISNKKINLSTRPSKVLSSSMKVQDAEIKSIDQLKINDVVRGFISNVTDKGIFVTLGHNVTAFVRVTNLSDTFLKSWKDLFQRDQLTKGKVISLEESTGHVQLSLKESVISGIYKPPVTFTSLHVGSVVTGKVVKVETFGVFILVDNSENVRGLCHRSEIAEQKIEDASKYFTQGDTVKAKVLKLDLPNRRINFGMKASYFADLDSDMIDATDNLEASDSGASVDGGVEFGGLVNRDDNSDDEDDDSDDDNVFDVDDDQRGDQEDVLRDSEELPGLSVGAFDWSGTNTVASSLKRVAIVDAAEPIAKEKKKKRKPEIQVDMTGDLDTNGPQSTDDFERLLMGEPDSSILWLQYMAFYLELGDVDAARQIGERALKSIGFGQDTEKMNVWTALFNLENAYGDDESVDGIFRRALEYNDAQEVYGRLISIYIQSGKQDKADTLFQEMLKKFTQDPKVYINYATFLFDTLSDADRGRAQLTRALQILPSFTHFDLTSKFAQLEFKSSAGLPERGRTIFEGLINSFPKRVDLFNVLLDLETKLGDKDVIRALFERIIERKLKPKQAKYFFKRWLAFEEAEGDERRIEEVKGKAATWVKSQS